MADRKNREMMEDPPFARLLFADTRLAALWLVARLYVGYEWLHAGLGKLVNPAWVETGAALKSSWEKSVAVPAPPARPPISYDWYRSFLQFMLDGGHYTWFAKLVVSGELLVGVALLVGAFVGVAAFMGGFMNWNFMMAGSASINPFLFAISVGLVLAWKTAGWYGVDRKLLPLLGTPWRPGRVFVSENQQPAGE